ncbi:hypothetical protein BZA05DRAFT_420562 [Tricharina praecox]|uniref:uncharacterized protein n=1 Tax=Tricharina praecox TaxID=43433 RepID=UPI00221F7A93|nr:uncharacterized protein BZA05DRAFT_420562 [Tricharina praecox]KAI5847505.1 hypothetical protein BZA05DRAFT_420562 [Tricharina praecox]
MPLQFLCCGQRDKSQQFSTLPRTKNTSMPRAATETKPSALPTAEPSSAAEVEVSTLPTIKNTSAPAAAPEALQAMPPGPVVPSPTAEPAVAAPVPHQPPLSLFSDLLAQRSAPSLDLLPGDIIHEVIRTLFLRPTPQELASFLHAVPMAYRIFKQYGMAALIRRTAVLVRELEDLMKVVRCLLHSWNLPTPEMDERCKRVEKWLRVWIPWARRAIQWTKEGAKRGVLLEGVAGEGPAPDREKSEEGDSDA